MQSFVVRWSAAGGRGGAHRRRAGWPTAGIDHVVGTGAWAAAGAGDVEGVLSRLGDRPTADLVAADAGYQWQIAVVGTAIAASTVADRRWSEAAYDLLAPYSGRNLVFGYVAYLGAVDHHLGTLATVLGRHDEAVPHLEAALSATA